MPERKLRCEKCGSEFFQDTEFRQYYAGTYSSAPGGELYAVPSQPASVRLCVCGHPLRAKTPPGAARRSLEESFAAALQCRAQAEPEALRTRLRGAFATKEELTALQAKLAALQAIVERRLGQTGAAGKL